MCWMLFNNKCLILRATSSYNIEHRQTCLKPFITIKKCQTKHHQTCAGCRSRINILWFRPLHHEHHQTCVGYLKELMFYRVNPFIIATTLNIIRNVLDIFKNKSCRPLHQVTLNIVEHVLDVVHEHLFYGVDHFIIEF